MADLSGWNPANKVEFSVDNEKVDDSLTDFPIRLNLDNLGSMGIDWSPVFTELGVNSKKIAITTSDGTTECYVEIENWDTVNGKANLWFKAPSLSSTVNTTFYLYYDNTHDDNTNVGDTGDAAAHSVWDDDYVAVYHMAQDPSGGSGSIFNSTSTNNVGTPIAGLSPANAGDDFDDGDIDPLWTPVSFSGPGYYSESGGQLEVGATAGADARGNLWSNLEISGDFAIEIDFSDWQYTLVSSALILGVVFDCNDDNYLSCRGYTVGGFMCRVNAAWTAIGHGATSGKMKLERIGSTANVYLDTGSGYVLGKTSTISTVPGKIRLEVYQEATTYGSMKFDNLRFISADHIAGPMTSESLVDGLIGNAIDFDGDSTYIDISADTSLELATALTVESTFKTSNTGSIQGLIRKDTDVTDPNRFLYGMSIRDTNLFMVDYYNGAAFNITSAATVTDGTWYYGAMTINGTTIEGFLDETSLGTDTITGTQGVPVGELNIGANPPNAGINPRSQFYNGQIDEVRISNIARSAAWLRATYYSNLDQLFTRIPYTIFETTPQHASTGISINSNIDVAFVGEIDIDTFNELTVKVSGIESWDVAYDAETSIATIVPYGNLNPQTIYQIEINGVEAIDGTPITPFSWYFITEPPILNNNNPLILWEKRR